MTYRLELQPEAEADLEEAYLWYETQRSGLGRELIECVEVGGTDTSRQSGRVGRHTQ